MDFYGYEEYYEPSEIEEALGEFKDSIRKMINRDIQNELNAKTNTIVELRKSNKKLKEESLSHRQQVQQSKTDGLKEKESKLIGKVKVGDNVYILKLIRKERLCEYCVDGKIKANGKKAIKCPKCYGSGKESYQEWNILEREIKEIGIRLKATRYGLRIEDTYYYVTGYDDSVHIFTELIDAETELESR